MFKVAIYNNAFINLAERIPLSKIPSILEELTTVQYKIKIPYMQMTLIEIALVKILQLEQEISTNQPNIKTMKMKLPVSLIRHCYKVYLIPSQHSISA